MVPATLQPTSTQVHAVTQSRRLAFLLILGVLTAFAPLSIDMYLPAMPSMEQALGVTGGRIQLTLAAFFLGFALGQGFFGPVADRFGRKPPLYVGLLLYVLASVGCATASDVDLLAASRFLQAVGACSGGVIARAMVRDLFEPKETARVFGSLMLVTGVAPILAPMLGGYLLIWSDWRAIFWVQAACGSVALVAVFLALPETHSQAEPTSLRLGSVLAGYWRLLTDLRFLAYALTGAMSIAGLFVYLAGSPFVFITLHGVPAEHFSWLFGINAAGFILAGQVNNRLLRRFGSQQIIGVVGMVQVAAGLLLALVAATGFFGLIGLMVPLFLYIACIGFIMPNSSALAMAPYARNAGMASALLGTLQFGLAAVSSALIGAIHAASAMPMAGLIAGAGLLSVACHRGLSQSKDSA